MPYSPDLSVFLLNHELTDWSDEVFIWAPEAAFVLAILAFQSSAYRTRNNPHADV